MNLFENLQKMNEDAALRTLSGPDAFGWQGANDFEDGSRPLIAESDYATFIISGSDDKDGSALISIYYGPDGDQWAWKTYATKEEALKDAKVLVKLIDEEVDTIQLQRFGFEM